MSNDVTGARKGDYIILGTLGAGGMGKVYKVRNSLSDRVEAMKVLLPDLSDQKDLADRFLREIKVLAHLHHPNIAELRTALTIDNQLVMIMEYVEGVTLSARIHEGEIRYADTLAYMDQVLAALAYAHAQHVVHRDIKPANMIVTPLGVTKLMDFGIARSGNDMALTMTGTTLGSVAYMSPEQVRCEPIDGRSDLYSIGVSLYEMITGQRPYVSDNNFEIMQAHLQVPPTEPIELKPDIPPALGQLIMMAMAKDPAKRFQTADALRAALKSVAPLVGEPSPIIPPSLASTTITAEFTPVPHAPATPRSITAKPVTAQPLRPPVTPQPATQRSPVTARPLTGRGFQPPPPTPAPPPLTGTIPNPAPATVPTVAPTPTKNRAPVFLAIAVVALVVIMGAIYGARMIGHKVDDSSKSSAPPKAPDSPATDDKSPNAADAKSDAKDDADEAAAAKIVTDAIAAAAKAATTKSDDPSAAALKSLPCKVDDYQCWSKLDKSTAATKRPVAPAPAPATKHVSPKSPAAPGTTTTPAPPDYSTSDTTYTPTKAVAGAPDPHALVAVEKEELDQLNARAKAINSSLEVIRKQQQAQGNALPSDVVFAQQRLGSDLTKAKSALDAGDVLAGQKIIDQAQTEIAKLDKFLGH